MLTVEVKLNGQLIAEAVFVPCGGIVSDGVTVTDDYCVHWLEENGEGLDAVRDADDLVIRRHSRGATIWALVAKAAAAILGQKIERMEGGG